MAVFLSHPIFLTPAFGSHHPLSISRHSALIELCQALDWLEPDSCRQCPLPALDDLARFHDRDYLVALRRASHRVLATPQIRARYNLGTMECPLFEGLWDRACATVGGAILAARLSLDGELPFHPAGGTHHGRRDRASGFCYLNDPVFAILTLLDAGLMRVLYVDLDAHHGDGVEEAFVADQRVMTISIHEDGRWPGTGRETDRRDGNARNLPVPRAFNDSEFALLMDQAVLPLGRGFSPDAVVITCGTDALAGDPLSGLALSNTALWDAVDDLRALAPRSVVLGGGGYNPWTLARCWAGLWARLSGRDLPDRLPAAAQSVLEGLHCDLIEDDEIDPRWLSTLADPRNDGPVRDEIQRLVVGALA